MKAFITAYNELVKFAKDQTKSAFDGDKASIGRDALLRQLRNQLRDAVGADYPGGTRRACRKSASSSRERARWS